MTSQRRSPLAILSSILAIAVLGLAAALWLVVRANGGQGGSAQTTVAALRTQVASQQAQLAAQATQVAQQQLRIAQLQGTPVSRTNGPRSYLASFQIDKYSYVLYMEWVESSGFVRDGRILTADNYAGKGSKTLTISGIDNEGSVGFTGKDGGATITFSGRANSDGSFTVTGLPWSVFVGFTGGTFTQTLHAGTMQDYNTAVANLAAPPS